MCIANQTHHSCATPTASLYIKEAVLVIQECRRATSRKRSLVSKEAVSAPVSQLSAIPKQVVLPFKVAGFVHLSMPLTIPKQLVLVPQVIYFLAPNAYIPSCSWPTSETLKADEQPQEGRCARALSSSMRWQPSFYRANKRLTCGFLMLYQ